MNIEVLLNEYMREFVILVMNIRIFVTKIMNIAKLSSSRLVNYSSPSQTKLALILIFITLPRKIKMQLEIDHQWKVDN